MSCGVCGKVRAHLPAAIRERLAAVEARMRGETTQGRIDRERVRLSGELDQEVAAFAAAIEAPKRTP